ncbi:MAG: hypothetical protein ABIQ11_07110 [Saprospiraceae bacterium]
MEKDLNILEQAIVNEIANYNEKQYSFVRSHLPFLRVKSRENTGVGMYVNFEYISGNEPITLSDIDVIALSSDKSLELDVLKYGLNYELNITKGKIDFLELVTNGESWDGGFGKFRFVK